MVDVQTLLCKFFLLLLKKQTLEIPLKGLLISIAVVKNEIAFSTLVFSAKELPPSIRMQLNLHKTILDKPFLFLEKEKVFLRRLLPLFPSENIFLELKYFVSSARRWALSLKDLSQKILR